MVWYKKFHPDCDEDYLLSTDKIKSVSLFKLFSVASLQDYFLVTLGVLAAIVSGLNIPVYLTLYGDIANVLVYMNVSDFNHTVRDNNTQCNSFTNEPRILGLFATKNSDAVTEHIRIFLFGCFLIGTLSILSNFVFITCLNIAAENQINRLRGAVFKAILMKDISWHDRTTTDGLIVRISENLVKIQNGMNENLGHFILALTITVLNLANAFYHGWKLALATLFVVPTSALADVLLSRVLSSLSIQEAEGFANVCSVAEEVIGSIKTVTAFNGQESEVNRFEETLKPVTQTAIKQGLISATKCSLVWMITNVSYAVVYWYGVKLALESTCDDNNSGNHYNAGTINTVFFSLFSASFRLGKLAPFLETISKAKTAAIDIFEILKNDEENECVSNRGRQLKHIDGEISFENVYFSYPSRPDVQVLGGFNFSVKAGETVALVGQSGCGKSTCIQLLQRFYDPVRGRITIDGHDVKDLDVRWWRENIGVVNQEPVLFSLSIRENILLGHARSEEITIEEIEKAAIQANAHDFITSLPRGYDTLVGERGAQLSGGQKQRIAIARALIRNPRILLFDEATSALDNQSEAVVQLALDRARQGRTTVVVAHRLTTIRNADVILVLNRGMVEQYGSHESLLKIRGLYSELIGLQEAAGTLNNSVTDHSQAVQTHEVISSISSSSQSSCSTVDERDTDNQHLQLIKYKKSGSALYAPLNRQRSGKSDGDGSILWKILKISRPELPYVIFGFLGSVLLGLSNPSFAIVMGEILALLNPNLDLIEAYTGNDFLSLVFLGIALATGIGAFFQIFMLTVSGEKLTYRLRSTAFSSILSQEISWFDLQENSVGSLCHHLASDTSAIQTALGAKLGWKLGLVCVFFILIQVIVSIAEKKATTEDEALIAKALDHTIQVGVEAISNIRTVVALGREETFCIKFMDSLQNYLKKAKKRFYIHGIILGLIMNISSFAGTISLCYGANLVKNEEMSYENVFKVTELIFFGLDAVAYSLVLIPNYGQVKSSASRIFRLIQGNSLRRLVPSTVTKEIPQGEIEFDKVHFSYPTRSNVRILNGMCTRIVAGQTVAIVGPSGCGKSTMIQLLQRFYDPNHGVIYVDGQDVTTLSKFSLRSKTAIVSQEPVLFNRTIAENIAYGDQSRSIPTEEIIEAATKANVHSFIQSLPLGYDTVVGQRGSQLSGGQKQRIAIARALIRNPRILLLDEATSALDAESERVVQGALDRASQDRTCIVIAHRLSSVINADLILVIDSGEIKEKGKHEDLIAMRGIYYQMWTVQSQK